MSCECVGGRRARVSVRRIFYSGAVQGELKYFFTQIFFLRETSRLGIFIVARFSEFPEFPSIQTKQIPLTYTQQAPRRVAKSTNTVAQSSIVEQIKAPRTQTQVIELRRFISYFKSHFQSSRKTHFTQLPSNLSNSLPRMCY